MISVSFMQGHLTPVAAKRKCCRPSERSGGSHSANLLDTHEENETSRGEEPGIESPGSKTGSEPRVEINDGTNESQPCTESVDVQYTYAACPAVDESRATRESIPLDGMLRAEKEATCNARTIPSIEEEKSATDGNLVSRHYCQSPLAGES